MVQPDQRLRVHQAGRRRQGCVRAHLGGRTRRSQHTEREPDRRVRAGGEPRQGVGREPQGSLNAAFGGIRPDASPAASPGGFSSGTGKP
ncbi:hypothetical protein chiPu_0028394 [Chiloscyllium punctatum]|uniref:Uncharacterized protein n=1 Tax=Chiloscyllium punctatum TaxID=137246 RepID=A0A401TPP6_CHIPU|nr:hypothetical protein [Chiloscyllium punctatum]